MTTRTVIGAAIIYYLDLEWWWWLLLGIALAIDISDLSANSRNLLKASKKLNDLENQLHEINETLEKIEGNTKNQ